ncbi:NAD-dependent succinate-semialdehyde dehydrogenase [Delftia acidovorans]|jgi:succinate-semialdehyde dehydrogenase/glutarate-semialdehyde dehydrogenase|uniref:NAD-dependent succinate-semialdehyde dehydrogenase n=1 Tax=Delftia acidovorans TaxID=80866 RepID=UPI00284A0508|nr:NAD-dependent succinate-semialdehyde dehydrogenase [Delftia acidovorans]
MQTNLPLHLIRGQCFVGGQWTTARDGTYFPVQDPATGQEIALVSRAGRAEALRAIRAADAALGAWKQTPARQRAAVLLAWADLVGHELEPLARILTAEQGKPLAEARAELGSTIAYLRWFAEEARRIDGQILQSPSSDQHYLVMREPVGVCAAITPWNFPSSMIARKVAPALAAGCTMVLKPAEQTPLSALALAVLAEQAGVPAGVFSVVAGDARAIGGQMCASAAVRKLSFTGSTAVGRLLMAQCAPTLKRLSLELGGNAPFIVFEGCDLDAAVSSAMAAKFRNTGQMCTCANRILVQDGVYDEFAQRLVAAVRQLRVGHGSDAQATQGPLIDGRAVAKVDELLADALARGAQLLCGGGRHALGGNFYTPTVLGGCTPDMRLAREEIFGPVAPLYRFGTEQEALALANDTEYGLAAYFFTADMHQLPRVLGGLEYGMVGVNTHLVSNEAAPFGGVKQSGLGREGAREGIGEYLETKFSNLQI